MKFSQIINFLILYGFIDIGETTESHERHKRNSRSCHRKYQEIPGHTACLPKSSEVVDTGVSEDDKRLILELHNNERRNVDPPAVAMLKMSWDDEVAMVAQAWAENCVQDHDKWYRRLIPGRFSVGQNLAWGWGLPKMTWNGAIRGWANEVNQFTLGGRNSISAVGHYTQMVWENSTKIGCGYAQCGSIYYYVCNYAPAGNLDFNNPYRPGTSCGQCSDTCRNNLCDCGDRVCLNYATMNVNTCSCSCLKFKHYIGDTCALDCDLLSEDSLCGRFYVKEECTRYSNYPFQCPGLCGICPYGGIAYGPVGRSTTLYSHSFTTLVVAVINCIFTIWSFM